MTNNELDLAIAEKLGYRKLDEFWWQAPEGYKCISYGLPQCASNLNDCHGARAYLTTPEHKVRYQAHLYKLAESKATRRNKLGQGLVSDYDAHTQGPREIAEAIYYALGGEI